MSRDSSELIELISVSLSEESWISLRTASACLRLLISLVEFFCRLRKMMRAVIRAKPTKIISNHCHGRRVGAFSLVSMMSMISGILRCVAESLCWLYSEVASSENKEFS